MNKRKKIAPGRLFPSWKEAANMLGLFILVMFTFIIFRSDTISQAFSYCRHLFSASLFSKPVTNDGTTLVVTIIFILIMFVVEWLQRDRNYGLQIDTVKRPALRIAIYYSLIIVIFIFKANEANQFIYFQF